MNYNSTMDTRALKQAYDKGQQAALEKFGAGIPESVSNLLTIPKGIMAAGAGAGLWDMVHGRGGVGSMGTALATGGGGLLGRMGGQALAARLPWMPNIVGELGGTAAGALLGRAASKERQQPVAPYGQPY